MRIYVRHRRKAEKSRYSNFMEEIILLRSVRKALELIQKDDKDTAVTLHAIRTWCKENKVRNVKVGNKILVDVESLLNYVNND